MPGAMVPYRRYGRIIQRNPMMRRYATAYNMAQYAYRNRNKIKWAARKIGGAFRRYKRYKSTRKHVGEPVSKDTCKKCDNHSVNVASLNGRFLVNYALLNLPETTINAIDSRQRDIVNCRGVKIMLEVRNNNDDPIYLNCAVIGPKQQGVVDDTNFFRDYSASRTVDFGHASLAGMDYQRLPINTDKYSVLWRKRYRMRGHDLENEPGNILNSGGVNYLNIQKYIKLNKQVRYDGSNVACLTPVFFVMWATEMFTTAPTPNTVGLVAYSIRTTIYFKEPKQ